MAHQEGLINLGFSTEMAFPANLYDKLTAQLEKDLGYSLSEIPQEALLAEIQQIIEQAVQHQKLGHILYTVDISEKQSAACLNDSNPIESLAHLVLKRVAQKVLFRWQYSRGI